MLLDQLSVRLVEMLLHCFLVLLTPRGHRLGAQVVHEYFTVNAHARHTAPCMPCAIADAETEVEVFVPHEEVLVPTAQLPEHISAD